MNCQTHPWYCSLILIFCWLIIPLAWADLSDISRIYHATPSLEEFEICWGGGCATRENLTLTSAEWQNVVAAFTHVKDIETERIAISKAVGILEDIVGTKTGTSADRAGTFGNGELLNQLDCNDEAINSTTYMRLMKSQNLIKFHDILDIRTRKFFFTGWPHSTAVIKDQQGKLFAVDAWFFDNGESATIIPFEQWKSGWKPPKSRAE